MGTRLVTSYCGADEAEAKNTTDNHLA